MRAWASLATLFLVTAFVGAWQSYSPAGAWLKFSLLLVGVAAAMGVAWVGRTRGLQGVGYASIAGGILAAAIAAYFLLAYDWHNSSSIKFAAIRQAGTWVQGNRPLLPIPEDIHSNVAGGALALLVPLGLGGAGWAWQRQAYRLLWLSIPPLILASLALILTSSRGAWGGVLVGIGAAVYLQWRATTPSRTLRRTADAFALGTLAGTALALLLALGSHGVDRWLSLLPGGDGLLDRINLWRDMLVLIEDTMFTGMGSTQSSPMLEFSSYVLLLHVHFISHAHNLFLQIALEQGVFGLCFFLVWLGVAIWHLVTSYQMREGGWLRAGITTALTASLFHGLLDSGLYFSRIAFIQFLPMGFALALHAPPPSHQGRATRWGVPASILGLIIMGGMFLAPPIQAQLLANRGTIAQMHAELSLYEWPAWAIQDEVRNSPLVDLDPAIRLYKAALARDPANVTANRRMGQIELSRGNYRLARSYLERAFDNAPHQRPTRQMLGELEALDGNKEQAVGLWQTIDVTQDQLKLRQWWYQRAAPPTLTTNFDAALSAYYSRMK